MGCLQGVPRQLELNSKPENQLSGVLDLTGEGQGREEKKYPPKYFPLRLLSQVDSPPEGEQKIKSSCYYE